MFAGDSHGSYYPQLVIAAFPFMLPPPVVVSQAKKVACTPISLPGETLDRLAGVYLLADGRAVTIRRQGASLVIGMQGYPEGQMLPETERRFCSAQEMDINMTFVGGEGGPPSAVDVSSFGVSFHAVRKTP